MRKKQKKVKQTKFIENISNNDIQTQIDKKKKLLFTFVLILIPILFFIILELSLRIFNYGIDNNQWIEIKSGKLILNPEIAYRYFWTKTALPYSIQDVFNKEKQNNSFRIFVLGESSAAGYPYLPLGSFSRFLQKKLELLYPKIKIEVINCAMTAINTYTIRDLVPEIIKQNPNLILIYTGHNEYYGALGVGSIESFGNSRKIINLILYLNKYKTFELMKNFIQWLNEKFKSNLPVKSDGTLMSRIAKEKMIPFGSEIYYKGLEQFKGNMNDILELTSEKNIPVIIGTLVSNLKDQYPFNSVSFNNNPKASQVFEQAQDELKKGNLSKAKILFNTSKNLDALRFRASDDFNSILIELGKQFNYPVIKFDSIFNANSPNEIVGNNLMTDHLHPTLDGYKLMSNEFFKTMRQKNFLPNTKPELIADTSLNILTELNFKFSKLDSVIAHYRILVLKNDWPFTSKEMKKELNKLIQPNNYVDSIAYDFLYNDLSWELAHRKMANYYLHKRDFENFKFQMDILIAQYPIVFEYYQILTNELLKLKRFDEAYNYLKIYYEVEQDAFSSKWLGIILLSKNKIEEAFKFLSISYKLNSRDTQVLYNLSGAYFFKKDLKNALSTINRCLELEPEYPNGKEFKYQLLQALK